MKQLKGPVSGKNVILSSEERKKLFNTFMKEMNQSLTCGTSSSLLNPAGKKKGEPLKYQRNGATGGGVLHSNPTSRPRSQLGAT
jgi:hypothetical protein